MKPREHSITLKFDKGKECKFFAYLAVSTSGPKLDDSAEVHKFYTDTSVKIEILNNEPFIYV